jgi:hypothetical protein
MACNRDIFTFFTLLTQLGVVDLFLRDRWIYVGCKLLEDIRSVQPVSLKMFISPAVSLVIETNVFGIFIFGIFKHIKRTERNTSTCTFRETVIILSLAMHVSYHYDSRDNLNY